MIFSEEHDEIVKRLKIYPVLCHFSKSELKKLVSLSEPVSLVADQILFSLNEPSDSVYYLIDGHLECFSSASFAQKVASIRSGEMIGETGVIANEPRGMVVRATRHSQLLKINHDIFIDFFQKKPEMLMLLAQSIARRFRHLLMNLQEKHYEYKSIGLISQKDDLTLTHIHHVFEQLIAHDNVHIHDKSTYESSQLSPLLFLNQCERHAGINLFLSTIRDGAWNHAVLNHVDYIYYLVDENDANNLDFNVLDTLAPRPCDVVIMHQQPAPYSNTAKFYASYSFKRHHHLRDTTADYQRLYRFMTGQAIGLVISGGGFRGFAHYGLVKALLETRVPIDYIGGSSMGAAIGALLAIQFDWTYFDNIFNRSMNILKGVKLWRHFTFPLLSILSGDRLTRLIMDTFGQYQIEDLPINFFCVVANLSKSQKDIKKHGELWEWLRASTAIPGLLPPFEKEGVVYVDGGVCTNLPVQDMRDELNRVGTIIALDIRIPPFHVNTYHFPPILTFRNILAHSLGLSRNHYVLPALFDVLVESSTINQYIYDTQGAKGADIMVAPDTSAINFSQARRSNSLALLAYKLAKETLTQQKSIYERWILA